MLDGGLGNDAQQWRGRNLIAAPTSSFMPKEPIKRPTPQPAEPSERPAKDPQPMNDPVESPPNDPAIDRPMQDPTPPDGDRTRM